MSLDMATGNRVHPESERGLDLYQTPPAAVRALLSVEPVPNVVWECACGPGSIVRELQRAERTVIATDLVSYGYPGSFGDVDFLQQQRLPAGCQAIVTNPPFMHADAFVAHAVSLAPEVYMLLRVAFLEGLRWYHPDDYATARDRWRCKDLARHLARVWVFAPRLPMMHREDWTGNKANSGMAFAWFVFVRNFARAQHKPSIGWLNPNDFAASIADGAATLGGVDNGSLPSGSAEPAMKEMQA